MLTRLTDDGDLLEGIFELDNATNDRLLAESGLLPGIDARELVFGIPSYRIINAAFCHPAPNGSRFNSADGAPGMQASNWRLPRRKLLTTSSSGCKRQIGTKKKSLITSIIARIFALNSTTFEEQRSTECLSPTSYVASQALAAQLWKPARRELSIPAFAALRNLYRVFSAGIGDQRPKG